MPAGRPTIYTPELAARICDRLGAGDLLIEICEEKWAPARSTVYKWARDNLEFSDLFAQARELQGHAAAEIAVLEARGATPENANAMRVRFDANKWFASKILPKYYGDNSRRELTGANGGPIDVRNLSTEQLTALLAAQTDEEASTERDP